SRISAMVYLPASFSNARKSIADLRRTFDKLAHRYAERVCHSFGDRIRLRVHGSSVQRIVAILDSQKTRRLLKCLFAETFNFAKLRSRSKRSILIAIRHDALGEFVTDPGYVLKKIGRSGVQIDTHAVHARLDSGGKTAFELSLIHVVLILADSNGLGFSLDQLGQRVLQTPGDRNRSPDRHIQLR